MQLTLRARMALLGLVPVGILGSGCISTSGWYSTIGPRAPLISMHSEPHRPHQHVRPMPPRDEHEQVAYEERLPMEQPASIAPFLPTEKLKVSFPPYVIETPDVVTIDVIRALPKGSYQVQPLDALVVTCLEAQPEPIAGVYYVEPDGRLNLGPIHGSVAVADMSLDQAQDALRKHFGAKNAKAQATVALAQTSAVKQIRGEHSLRPDGTIGLGDYGSVYVAGMTLDDAKQAIEEHLAKHFNKPVVNLDVRGYNSKYYYVIVNVAGVGESVHRFLATGNETVLDALAHAHLTVPALRKQRVWVARPVPPNAEGPDQILPVNWNEITQAGGTRTNYQLLPGDRVYVLGCR